MRIKHIIAITDGPIIKSHCQWCGEEINHTQKQHDSCGNMCQTCKHDFYLKDRRLIDSHELLMCLFDRRKRNKYEVWNTIDGQYLVDNDTKTGEFYE